MFDEDDDYYDEEDDDEYEEDDDEEGGRGALILVGFLVLVAVGAVAVAIILLTGGDDGPETVDATPSDLDAGDGAADDPTPSTDAGFDFGSIGVLDDPETPSEPETGSAPPPAPRPTTTTTTTRATSRGSDPYASSTRSSGSSGSSRSTGSSGSSGSSRSGGSSDVVISYSGSGSGSSGSSSAGGSSSSSGSSSTSGSSSGSSASAGDTRDPYATDSGTTTAAAADPTPEPEPAGAPDPNLSYEKDFLASLGGSAASGSVESNVVTHLQAVPQDHPNYWQAWAILAKNAEAKKDYRGHCDATEKIIGLSRFKYSPEFNLEMAKCHLRNSRLSQAIDNADRTIGNAMDMSSSQKTEKLLLAYKIRAKCRTLLYAADARQAAGLGDANKLTMAIQAWSDYSNYATGIGNTSAQQEADRELADLKARQSGR